MSGVWSPLTTHWAVTTECEPRTVPVDSIGHHHAASTSLPAVLAAMQPGGRDVSANYVIYRDQVWGVVPENARAYCSASRQDDNRSIVYEIINSSGGPDWSFDPVTLDTVMRLDADIMRRYGVRPQHAIPGFWEHRNLWEWFRRSYPTACAGPSFHMAAVITGAVQYTVSPVTPKEIKVKSYHYQDATARSTGKVLKPGTRSYLHTTKDAPLFNAVNVVGGVGPYSITPHIYAEGQPGDVLELALLWDDTKTPGPHSAHYLERLVLDRDGLIRASVEFKRQVASGYAVYVQVAAPEGNVEPVKITLLDCDAYLFVVA